MKTDVLFSSKDMTYTTPDDLFDRLNKVYQFTLDPCCVPETAKCKKYFTPKENGLKQSWEGERVFMNPPYGRGIIDWMKKAYDESLKGALVVCLVPARTDTIWFHEYGLKGHIEYIRGRLKFGGMQHNAPFPSIIITFAKWGINEL